MALEGGPAETVVESSRGIQALAPAELLAERTARRLAAAGGRVCWVDASRPGSLGCIAEKSGQVTILADDLIFPAALAIHGQSVFWGSGLAGPIQQLHIPTQKRSLLVPGDFETRSITASGSWVVWTASLSNRPRLHASVLAYQRQTGKLLQLVPHPAMHDNLVQDGITAAAYRPKTAALTPSHRVHWISGMPTALLWQVDLNP